MAWVVVLPRVLTRALARRELRPRPCRYCGEPVALRASTAAGHRGFCSREHAVLDQEETPF